MTDHRLEVRCLSEYAHHKESCDIECLMADEHPSCTCGLMEALATLSAPPIEPVGIREALAGSQRILEQIFETRYAAIGDLSAQIIENEAALQPKVEG